MATFRSDMDSETLSPAHAHQNRRLFSNHFLERRLRDDPVWLATANEADRVRDQLRALIAEKRPGLSSANEAQTEERWIRPVLRALGWGFVVQPRSERLGTTQFPDYALFPTAVSANAAAGVADHRHVLKQSVGVLEAKRWGRGLDAVGGAADSMPNRVPSVQIINYLIRAEQPWGILTNGGEWRLYHRDADFADTVFFAVDLPALLGDDDLTLGEATEPIPAAEAFRYFYLFFRPEAFQPDEHDLKWLDRAMDRSLRYARAVEEALKPRAYRAVTALCRGFAATQPDSAVGVATDPALGTTVLDNALTLLFRMLFILYAESRELLPVRTNRPYRNKSFLQLRDRAARIRDGEDEPFPMGRDLWNDLRDLFAIIDGAEQWRAVGIPVYNGGLFDSAKHPWLDENYVPDPYLAEAIDLLSRTRDPERDALHQVDYAPLDVRQLGSIYEGLLEHVLRLAQTDLPAIREKGQVVRDPVRAGELYLADDSGERKVSGSYYTPDYVVQYIVDRTLAPLVEGRSVAEILELRVLDPAMGSGHFLVAATSFLARAAVRATDEGNQRLLGEFAQLDPEHLRRLVVERCIFGVDKNPRAVELAKLALWIATVQKDKPLNFLDHHLKRGDSLLGARLRQLGSLPGRTGQAAALEAGGQVGLFEDAFRQQVHRVVSFVRQIEALPSDSLDDIEMKERLYGQADAMLGRFRDAADLWASRLFDNPVNDDQYDRLVERLRADRDAWDKIAGEEWFRSAKELWRQHQFFHWDLEFAEVFFDEQGNDRETPGFDVVIGNPPYVRMEEFKELKNFLRATYQTHATRTDLYVYFVERSLDLLRDGGQYGAILSNKFLRANYGKPLRALIGRQAGVREIVDFGGLPVFPEATVRSAITIIAKGEKAPRCLVAEVKSLSFSSLADQVGPDSWTVDPSTFQRDPWVLVPAQAIAILDKIQAVGTELGDLVGNNIAYGIKTGFNSAFFLTREERDAILDRNPLADEVIKPLIVGQEIRRYYLAKQDHWIIYLQRGSDLSRYPAISEHLEPFRQKLEARATNQRWWELQQSQPGYRIFFETDKILYPVIADDVRFALARGPLYPNDKCYLIPEPSLYVLALLNSALSAYILRNMVARLEGASSKSTYLEFRTQYMERLPIRRIEPRTSERGRAEMGAWLQSLYFRGLKLAGIEPDIPDKIRALGPKIGELDGVERVLLIGSWARGHGGDESDVDLLVIDRPDGRKTERKVRIREHVGRVDQSLDLHVYSTDEVERLARAPSSFLSHVLPEGVVLYERG